MSRRRSKYEWHHWFAWHPVNLPDRDAWLQFVERRWIVGGETFAEPHWEYRGVRR